MEKIILICSLLASSISFGADSDIYSISTDNNSISTYDKGSVKQLEGNSYRVWTNTTDQKQGTNLVINNYINCKNETLNHSDIYLYKDGKILNSISNQSDIVTPPPNSTGWQLISKICRSRAP